MSKFVITNGKEKYYVEAKSMRQFGDVVLIGNDGVVAVVPKNSGFAVIECQQEATTEE